MENQTVNTGNNTDNNSGTRMFTQAEVDNIVQARLSRGSAKELNEAEKALEQREKELSNRERAIAHKAALKDGNFPEEIYEALNCTSDETFFKSLEILGPYFKKLNEPMLNAVGKTGSTIGNAIRKAMGLE